MAGARGLLVAGIAVVILEAMTGVVAIAAFGPVNVAFYLLACAAATALVTGVVARLIRPSRSGGEGGEAGRRGGGPGDDGGPGDRPPPWWPEFEREFWREVQGRRRTPA